MRIVIYQRGDPYWLKFLMFSNFRMGLFIVLGSICSCRKWYDLSILDPPNSYNGQIRRKIAVLSPFWMTHHFFSRQNFSFFSSGIERPFYWFSANVWFSRVISNGFGSKLLRNLGKTAESALFRQFSWYVEVIFSQTVQKWSSKLYTGWKPKERPFDSIGKKSKNFP